MTDRQEGKEADRWTEQEEEKALLSGQTDGRADRKEQTHADGSWEALVPSAQRGPCLGTRASSAGG